MKIIGIAFFSFIFVAQSLFAQIFSMGAVSAMGSSYSSVGDAPESICINPASVSYNKNLEILISGGNKFQIDNYYHALAVIRLSKYDILKLVPSLFYYYENASGIIQKQTINLTFGNFIFNRFYLGAGLNYINMSVGDKFRTSEALQFQNNKFEANFGMIAKIFKNIKMSLVLNHFLTSEQLASINREIIFGMSYSKTKVSAFSLDVLIDSRDFFYKNSRVSVDRIIPKIGFERYLDFFNTVVRAGLDGLFNPTIGMGVYYDNVEIDYSYLVKLNGSHIVSLKYTF